MRKHRILGIIPAREGSKRLLGKNIKELLNKPLIQWTIDQAKKSKLIDLLMVNSDSNEICKIASNNGVESYLRKKELAQDDSSIYDVIFDQIKVYKDYDVVVLLEPTSPLRKDDDIDRAIQQFLDSGKDSLVSIGIVGMEAPNCYFPYGVIYISKVESLKKYKSFYQPNMSFYLIEDWQCEEVNTQLDFIKIEAIAKWQGFTGTN